MEGREEKREGGEGGDGVVEIERMMDGGARGGRRGNE